MAKKDTPKAEKKPEKAKAIKTLEEDDEFEDFPEDDWSDNKCVGKAQHDHLWDETWEDHDDDNDNFTEKLRTELNKNQ